MPPGSTLKGNNERDACHGTRPNRTIVFLRSPQSHVYSQFLECKYDAWGKKKTNHTTFPRGDMATPSGDFEEWLRHLAAQTADDFNCYHPRNLQTRYMACASTPGHIPHHYQRAELASALRQLEDMAFVGIADFYEESVCAFEVFVTGRTQCTCVDGRLRTNIPTRHNIILGHSVPSHSLHDVSPESLALIDALTQQDQALYEAALTRFREDVAFASQKSSVDLWCGARARGSPSSRL